MSRVALLGSTIAMLVQAAGCAGGPDVISPADLPRLQAESEANPTDGITTLRLAAAMQASGDCNGAIETARRGMALRPQDPLGPLVAGECLEDRGDAADAVALYEAYAAAYPTSLGTPAVAARAMLARRASAADEARELLTNEGAISAADADPNVLAVMPLEVIGEEMYQALSFGLASMITSDLALLERIRLVERTQLDALLREIQLAQAGVVDPATAARAGRMLRAGTVAHGLTHVTPDERLRLELSLMDSGSRIIGTESSSGSLRDLFTMEKNLVLAVVARLGYQVSQVERNAILENGTQNLAAFLAYSQGLLEQNAGNYAAAAREFSRAVQADPGFQQARDAHQVSSGAVAVQDAGAGAVTTLAATSVTNPSTPTSVESVAGALATGVQDVAPTLAEALGGGVGTAQAAVTATATAPPSTTGSLAQLILFNFRVVLRLP